MSRGNVLYSHTSTFWSPRMELQVNSPQVKPSCNGCVPMYYNDSDCVTGQVLLDPSSSFTGHLTISVEGTFVYTVLDTSGPRQSMKQKFPKRERTVFFSSSHSVSLWPSSSSSSPRTRLRRPSFARNQDSSANTPPIPRSSRSVSFRLDLPTASRPGEEIPPTFLIPFIQEGGSGKGASVEGAEVSYRISAFWEARDGKRTEEIVEAPIQIIRHSDAVPCISSPLPEPHAWLEMQLMSDRRVPFHCAITLPSPAVFSRTHTVPYFVIFTTTHRSMALAREIASDATVTVNFVRQVTTGKRAWNPPTPPHTPPHADAALPVASESPRTATKSRPSHQRRNSPPVITWKLPSPSESSPKASFENKIQLESAKCAFSHSRVLQSDVSIGFPKRPRRRSSDPHSHPSLDSLTSLPDGLFKGVVRLNKGMLPGIDYCGVNVNYYLDISVVFGEVNMGGRVPVRIL